MDNHPQVTPISFIRKALRYIYYKFVRVRELFKIIVNLRLMGVRRILRLPLVLPDGTVLNLTRTYYDYLVLSENVYSRVYEKHLPEHFSPKVILDLGAHKGFFSVMAAKRFPEAQIYAVEPSSGNYRFLLENIKSFPNIHPIKAAVWNSRGTVSLHTGSGDSVNYSLFDRHGLTSIESVTTLTLDDLPKADFIKCDIEGSEHALTFNAPYIALEVHDDIKGVPGNVINNLDRSGYDIIFEPPIAYARLVSTHS